MYYLNRKKNVVWKKKYRTTYFAVCEYILYLVVKIVRF